MLYNVKLLVIVMCKAESAGDLLFMIQSSVIAYTRAVHKLHYVHVCLYLFCIAHLLVAVDNIITSTSCSTACNTINDKCITSKDLL